MLCQYLHNTLLPVMIKEETGIEKGSDSYTEALKETLYKHGLTKICPSTCYNWLRLLGFTYCAQKKGYFVDGHEKPATVAYRKEFISRYLTYERRTYRWVQLPKTEALDLQESGKILKDTGFSYTDSAGKEMIEYHVDDIYKAIEQNDQDNQQGFGGNLSVRFDGTKPLTKMRMQQSANLDLHKKKTYRVVLL